MGIEEQDRQENSTLPQKSQVQQIFLWEIPLAYNSVSEKTDQLFKDQSA